MCSNETDSDERCVTCIENYIVYDGICVECLSKEMCPFNNSKQANCTDDDHSHCGFFSTSCNNFNCQSIDSYILIAIFVAIAVLLGIPSVILLTVFFTRRVSNRGYGKMNQDPFFSSYWDSIDVSDSSSDPLLQNGLEFLSTTDYRW